MNSFDDKNYEKFQDILSRGGKVVLELGCGDLKKDPSYLGVDIFPLPGVDFVHNMETGLSFIPDNTVDEITSSHFLEHIVNFELLMKEIHRVLKKDGLHKVTVPHFSNPFYYSDFTHKRFF